MIPAPQCVTGWSHASAMCEGMKPRSCMSRAMRFSSDDMRAVGGIADTPENNTNWHNTTTIRATSTTRNVQHDEMTKIIPTVDGNKFATGIKHQTQTSHGNKHTSKQICQTPYPPSSMLACTWRNRRCAIYVFRLPPLCDRLVQHNIEHLGQGEHQNQSAYKCCTCTVVANFLPSTISFNVVKDPWHKHLTTKITQAYAQQSTMTEYCFCHMRGMPNAMKTY